MTILNLVYCVLGAVFIALGAACLWEKYRTVRGGMRLPARILECRRQGVAGRKRSTNDSFWFERPNRVGSVIEIWYNPATPTVVERRSAEAEILGVLFVAMGFGVIFCLGLH